MELDPTTDGPRVVHINDIAGMPQLELLWEHRREHHEARSPTYLRLRALVW